MSLQAVRTVKCTDHTAFELQGIDIGDIVYTFYMQDGLYAPLQQCDDQYGIDMSDFCGTLLFDDGSYDAEYCYHHRAHHRRVVQKAFYDMTVQESPDRMAPATAGAVKPRDIPEDAGRFYLYKQEIQFFQKIHFGASRTDMYCRDTGYSRYPDVRRITGSSDVVV